jgi:hypothetical protein
VQINFLCTKNKTADILGVEARESILLMVVPACIKRLMPGCDWLEKIRIHEAQPWPD